MIFTRPGAVTTHFGSRSKFCWNASFASWRSFSNILIPWKMKTVALNHSRDVRQRSAYFSAYIVFSAYILCVFMLFRAYSGRYVYSSLIHCKEFPVSVKFSLRKSTDFHGKTRLESAHFHACVSHPYRTRVFSMFLILWTSGENEAGCGTRKCPRKPSESLKTWKKTGSYSWHKV